METDVSSAAHTTTANPTAPDVQTKVDTRVAQYIKLRTLKESMTAEFEQRVGKVTSLMEAISGELQAALDAVNATSIKTKYGTAIVSTRYSASLSDAHGFMNFVIAGQHWDLIDKRANATACRAFVTENKELPPGVTLSAIRSVGVRRPRGGGAPEEKEDDNG